MPRRLAAKILAIKPKTTVLLITSFVLLTSANLLPSNMAQAKASASNKLGLMQGTINVQGDARKYSFYAPDKAKTHNVPILFALHGSGGNGNQFAQQTQWLSLAKSKQFIVVFPDAKNKQWNDGRSNNVRQSTIADDVRFLNQLAKAIEFDYHVDKYRFYVTGFSNGGMMAQYWLLQNPSTIKGLAVAGSSIHRTALKNFDNLNYGIPVLIMHGTRDPIIPWKGSIRTIGDFSSVRQTLHVWLMANGGVEGPTTVKKLPDQNKSDGTQSEIHQFKTKSGFPVWLVKVYGGGHAMSKQVLPPKVIGNAQQDFSAETLMWDFLTH